MPKKLIGYWREKEEYTKPYNPDKMIQNGKVVDPDFYRDPEYDKYPWPKSDKAFWANKDKEKVIAYLKAGQKCNHYRGGSKCRLCGDYLSSFERTDGTWVWPDKLEHYIEKHDIILPEEFIADALLSNVIDTYTCSEQEVQDETFWLQWGKTSK